MGFPQTHAAIIGLGLIGGSLADAFHQQGLAASVIGIDTNPNHLEWALQRGWIRNAFLPDDRNVDEALKACNLVLIATPVDKVPMLFRWLRTRLRPGTLVSDVGSVKQPVLVAAAEILGSEFPFVGGHPMAGRERSGPEFATAELLQNATYAICPGEPSGPEALERMRTLTEGMGCRPLIISAAEHDRLVALSSHLPYVLALALTERARRTAQEDERLLQLLAGSFRDATRVASGDPGMSTAMCLGNRMYLLEAIQQLRGELDVLEAMLAPGREIMDGHNGTAPPFKMNEDEFQQLAETAKAFRDQLQFPQDGNAKPPTAGPNNR